MPFTRPAYAVLAIALLALSGCDDRAHAPWTAVSSVGPEAAALATATPLAPPLDEGAVARSIDALNERLEARGALHRVQRVEWSTALGAAHGGTTQTVFANDRTLRFDTRWVPNDPRRSGAGLELRHGLHAPLAVSIGGADLAPATERSLDLFGDVACSALRLRSVELPAGVSPSFIATPEELGDPGLTLPDAPAADIVTVGFVSAELLDAVLGPGASAAVLGVTFHFVFVDERGRPTDLDRSRRLDSSYKEIWYNAAVPWADAPAPGIDLASVVLHEIGHGVELDHFGRIFTNRGNGRLQVSPHAVMNAAYTGPIRDLLGTDRAAFCGLFANWPKGEEH